MVPFRVNHFQIRLLDDFRSAGFVMFSALMKNENPSATSKSTYFGTAGTTAFYNLIVLLVGKHNVTQVIVIVLLVRMALKFSTREKGVVSGSG